MWQQLAAATPSDVHKEAGSRSLPPPPRIAAWRSDPDAREAVRSEEDNVFRGRVGRSAV